MLKVIILFLGVFMLGLAACKVYKQKTVVKSDSEIWATYSKGSCFGKCPVFEFIIFENGNAIYVGDENVEKIGTYAATLDSTQQASLKMAFENSGFMSLEDEYLSDLSDLPIISVQYGPKTCDFHKRNAPKQLWELTEALDKCIGELNWDKE